MNQFPSFTYVLRRWSTIEKCQAQVVLISSSEALSWPEVRKRLESLTHHPADEFEEIHQETDTAMALDTWERGIENLKPTDMDFPAVKTYSGWWEEKMLTPTAIY